MTRSPLALKLERLCSIIESLLMISPEPITVARIVEVIRIEDPQTDESVIKDAVKTLVGRYQDGERPLGRGFCIDEIAGGLQVRTVAANAPYVRRFLAARPHRLSRAALETLSIIAYRQPATKPEVEAIRGVDVGAALKNLLDRDFVRILGKKDEVGRPIIYGTTEYFLEFFGLKSLAELPTLREYHELDDEHQKEVAALEERQSIRELAQAASFLVDREDDPDLEALAEAVKEADDVRASADAALGVENKEEEAPAPNGEAEPAADGEGAPEAEAAVEADLPADAEEIEVAEPPDAAAATEPAEPEKTQEA